MIFFLEQHGHLKSRHVSSLSKLSQLIQAEERTVIDGFLFIAAIIDILLKH